MNRKDIEILSNFDLEEFCKAYKIPLVACVAKNDLKHVNLINGSYIININNSDSMIDVGHWIGLYINNDTAYYFDSFGMNAPKEIIKYVKTKCSHLFQNETPIQNLDQLVCGYYAFYFCWYFHNSKCDKTTLNKFVNQFDLYNSHNNDNILQALIKKNILKK